MDGNSKSPVDNVNHPAHYQTKSGMETIDVIEAFTENLKGCEAINTGNVLKYMCRWKNENGLEDLKKARWYLDRLIAHVEKEEEIAERISNIFSTFSSDSNNSMTTAYNQGGK